MSRRRTKIELQGGLNITGSDTELLPGQVIQSINVEPALRGGYRRIEGYERDDGRGLSSEVHYCLINCEATTVALAVGTEISIVGNLVLLAQDAPLNSVTLSVSSLTELPPIVEGTPLFLEGVQITLTSLSPEREMVIAAPFAVYGDALAGSANGLVAAVANADSDAGGATREVVISRLINDAWVEGETLYEAFSDIDNFGYSIALSSDGSVLAIGAPNFNEMHDQGTVYVYILTNGIFTLQQTLIISNGSGDQFGEQVRLSSDGLRLFVSSPGRVANNNGIIETGAIFEYVSAAGDFNWQQTALFVYANVVNIKSFK